DRVERHHFREDLRPAWGHDQDLRCARRVTDAGRVAQLQLVREPLEVGREVGPAVDTRLVTVAVAARIERQAAVAAREMLRERLPDVRVEAGGMDEQDRRPVAAPVQVVQGGTVCPQEALAMVHLLLSAYSLLVSGLGG